MRADGHCALGIDIGGTDTKFSFWSNGQVSANNVDWFDLTSVSQAAAVGKFSTPKPHSPLSPLTVNEFCSELIQRLDAAIPGGVPWQKLDAIGLSWAGGVRENRIVATSGVLSRMAEPDSKGGRHPYSANSPVNAIHSVHFLAHFRAAIPYPVKPHLALALENDGSAEALGNNAARLISANELYHETQSTVVMKLGTSLAGGRVTQGGTIGDDIAEYSKAHLNMNAPPFLMRDFISSIAIRSTARTMTMTPDDLEPVFGEYGGYNRIDPTNPAGDSYLPTRVEAEDIGRLLTLWVAVDSERTFLSQCVDALVSGRTVKCDSYIAQLTGAFATDACRHELESLVAGLGALMWRKLRDSTDAEASALRMIGGTAVDYVRNWESASTKDSDVIRRLGMSRLHWLVTGQAVGVDGPVLNEVPSDTPWNQALARKTIGAVVLLSLVGMHMAQCHRSSFSTAMARRRLVVSFWAVASCRISPEK